MFLRPPTTGPGASRGQSCVRMPPISRVLSCRPVARAAWTTISLAAGVADGRPAPTCGSDGAGSTSPRSGLAPGGVCSARCLAAPAVGSYPTISPLPRAGCPTRGGILSVVLSLSPRHTRRLDLPVTLPYGARTFLGRPVARSDAVVQRRAQHRRQRGMTSLGAVGHQHGWQRAPTGTDRRAGRRSESTRWPTAVDLLRSRSRSCRGARHKDSVNHGAEAHDYAYGRSSWPHNP